MEIDISECGRFVETDLQPWSRFQRRTADGVREKLAASIGIRFGASVRSIVYQLVIPVLENYNGNLSSLKRSSAIQTVFASATTPEQGAQLVDAAAWLKSGFTCDLKEHISQESKSIFDEAWDNKSKGPLAAAFMMYRLYSWLYDRGTEHQKRTAEYALAMVADEFNRRRPTFTGTLYKDFRWEDAIKKILETPEAAAQTFRNLMQTTYEHFFRDGPGCPNGVLQLAQLSPYAPRRS